MIIASEIEKALTDHQGIVAVESSMMLHDKALAIEVEAAIRKEGAIPAIIGILSGQIVIGLTNDQVEHLASIKKIKNCGQKDLPIAQAMELDALTNNSAAMYIANLIGIKVLTTGGIGGIDRENSFDVSSDLEGLAHNPLVVVCSGVKTYLDLEATREWLETMGVPIVGYDTEELPAYFSRESGIRADFCAKSLQQVAAIARKRDELGLDMAVLVGVPVPAEFEINRTEIEDAIHQAMRSAREEGIRGAISTHYMLSKLNELTAGATDRATESMIINNARVAAQIAVSCAAVDEGQNSR